MLPKFIRNLSSTIWYNWSVNELSDLTDEQLEKIICRAENTHSDGSQYLKAKNTLEVRRNRKLFTLQAEALKLQNQANIHKSNANKIQLSMLRTTQSGLNRIIKLLNKPVWVVLLASIWGLIIGITLNVITAYVCSWLHCPVK